MKRIKYLCLIIVIISVFSACSVSVTAGKKSDNMSGEISSDESAVLLSQPEFLPIGTVVTLENEEHKVMIIGVLQFESEDRSVLYDYSGVLYPEGLLDSKEDYLFNKEDIEEIHYLGYNSEEQEEIQKYIEEALEKYNDLESGK